MKVLRRKSLLSFLVLCLTFGLAASAAAADKVLGLYGDWGAQTFTEGKHTGCSMWSQPTKDQGKYKQRGPIYAYVTHPTSTISPPCPSTLSGSGGFIGAGAHCAAEGPCRWSCSSRSSAA